MSTMGLDGGEATAKPMNIPLDVLDVMASDTADATEPAASAVYTRMIVSTVTPGDESVTASRMSGRLTELPTAYARFTRKES